MTHLSPRASRFRNTRILIPNPILTYVLTRIRHQSIRFFFLICQAFFSSCV
jgi:hypothetical protein